MLAVVANDLRNPLGSFMIQLSLLRRPGGRRERRSMKPVNELERAVMRMSRTLSDLVELTKIESGQLDLARTQVAAGDLIVEIVEAMRDEANRLCLELQGDALAGRKLRGHRPRTGARDRARDRSSARRPRLGREQAGVGQHLLVLVADRPRVRRVSLLPRGRRAR